MAQMARKSVVLPLPERPIRTPIEKSVGPQKRHLVSTAARFATSGTASHMQCEKRFGTHPEVLHLPEAPELRHLKGLLQYEELTHCRTKHQSSVWAAQSSTGQMMCPTQRHAMCCKNNRTVGRSVNQHEPGRATTKRLRR